MNRLYALMGMRFERPLKWHEHITVWYFLVVMFGLLLGFGDNAPYWVMFGSVANLYVWAHFAKKLPEPIDDINDYFDDEEGEA